MINWQSDESHLLINPKLAEWKTQWVQSHEPTFLSRAKGHIWLLTSGTTGHSTALKLVGLRKDAFLESAKSVNEHIQSTSADVWLRVLPEYHVSGLSILARSELSGAKVFSKPNLKWSPTEFVELIQHSGATLISLVPTQVFDLVESGIRCPKKVRLVFVGGGSISQALYSKAVELGWPILITYGMTEMASQIATSSVEDIGSLVKPQAKVLNHVEAKTSPDGHIAVSSKALFSEYAFVLSDSNIEFKDPKKQGWFVTGDVGEVVDNVINVYGRGNRVKKVLGELVLLDDVERSLRELIHDTHVAVIAIEHARSGNELVAVTSPNKLQRLNGAIKKYNQSATPFERISKAYLMNDIPTSVSGKVLYQELSNRLSY